MNEELIDGHQRRIWWICSAGPGHVWQADATTALFEGNACPCCAGKPAEVTDEPDESSLAEPNGAIPVFFRRGWWICRNNDNHVWYVKPESNEDTSRPCCPYCRAS